MTLQYNPSPDTLTAGSLFSGVGGIDLALERRGIRILWQIENDPYCIKVLQRHWPEVRRYGDIREIDPTELEPVDVVAGGPPCQPVSLAGKRRGEADDRWLWGEALRIVAGLRPRWCLFENPAGFVSMGFDLVLSRLEALGYSCRAAVIPACAVGAPHRRDRVWIVAYARGPRRQQIAGSPSQNEGPDERRPSPQDHELTGDGEGRAGAHVAYAAGKQMHGKHQSPVGPCERRRNALDSGEEAPRQEDGQAGHNCAGGCGQDVAHATEQGLQNWGCSRFSKTTKKAETRLEPGFERCCSRPAQPEVGRVPDGPTSRVDGHRWPAPLGCEQYEWEPPRLVSGRIPYRRQRLQALGNAVVPQVVERIGRAIITVEELMNHGMAL